MRQASAILVLLLLGFAVPVLADSRPDIRIAEILASPDATVGQREFIELHNAGAIAVDLTGWMVRDAPTASNNTNTFTFPEFLLDAGRRIVVWSNGTPDGTGFSWSTSAAKTVWNDAGDAATLLDADGAVRDWVGYGATTQPAPAGFEATKPASPTKGKSLQWADDAWLVDAPTPGQGWGEVGGSVSASVANVPPSARLQVPSLVRPAQAVAVHVTVNDDNGPDDIAVWTLEADGVVVQRGNHSVDEDVIVVAPPGLGNWSLRLTARDAAGANASAGALVTLVRPVVSVVMPPDGAVRFLQLQPGQRNATSLQPFTVRNDGPVAVTPLMDVSPLRFGRNTIPVDGNLWLGLDDGAGPSWVQYLGPLQALPDLEPGGTVTILLRIAEVPTPSAAGVYGTAFTVVPA